VAAISYLCVRDGATRSGLVCTLSYVLERLKLDRDVDVFQSVRHARINRPQVIPVSVSLLLLLLLHFTICSCFCSSQLLLFFVKLPHLPVI